MKLFDKIHCSPDDNRINVNVSMSTAGFVYQPHLKFKYIPCLSEQDLNTLAALNFSSISITKCKNWFCHFYNAFFYYFLF